MAPPNLTRTDAARRAALLEVAEYVVEIDLTDGAEAGTGAQPGQAVFATTTTARFRCTEPGADSWIDLVAAEVATATLNGSPLDVSGYREDDGIALPGLSADNELRVEARGRYMNTGEGLHRFVDPVDGSVYLYSQFETADAKRLFACFDQPDLKARYQLTVTAPADWKVVSNAAVAEITDGPGGSRVHRFGTTEVLSTYLVALIAGPYANWHDEHDGIPLGIYCRSSLAEHMDAERLFTETKQGFDFYHRNFGVRYPFGKYDQLFVPEFNAGAMENAGAVTFLEDYVFRSRVTRFVYERRAETVLHEMAHMWFGDLVTMRWWDDLWLNESFATFASVLCQAEATEYTEAWTTFANVEKSWAYRQDQLPSTHPVAADIPDLQAVEVNFDGITYAKGASVLKQLVAYVGLEPFLAGLRSYFTDARLGQRDVRRPDRRPRARVRAGPVGLGRAVAAHHRAEPAAPLVRRRRRRAGSAGSTWCRAGPGRAPARCARTGSRSGCTTTRTRRQAGPHAPGGGRRHRRADRGAGAARRAARQAGAGQRRRSDLLRVAARPGVAGHAGGPDRRHRRAVAAHPVLVGGLGDDPRGRAEGPRLHRAGGRRLRRRVRGRRGPAAAAAGPDRGDVVRRRAVGGRAGLADAGGRAARSGWTPRRPARTRS